MLGEALRASIEFEFIMNSNDTTSRSQNQKFKIENSFEIHDEIRNASY